MVYSLTWLPSVLRNAGLKVAEVDGWESRGRGEMGAIKGVMCHHTVGAASGNMPSLRLLVEGRSDLRGPLSQLGLGRDGTYYVIGAGRANHAGKGKWQGIAGGNSHFVGIEAEHTGKASDPWPAVQVDAYQRGVAAILRHIGQPEKFCCGHKEFALPSGRKPDPTFDMNDFRAQVAAILNGSAPPPVLIPAVEPEPAGNNSKHKERRPTIRRGDVGRWVRVVQQTLDLTDDGHFGPKTEAKVRAVQRLHGLVPDGIVGPQSWRLLDDLH